MKSQRSGRLAQRFAAITGAAALVLAGVAAAAPASAAPPHDLPTTPGSVTIHKFQQPDPAGAANHEGEEIAVPADWVALGGVQFTLTPITNVDLTTEAGWDLANQYAADPSDATMVLGTAQSFPVTSAAGEAALTGLANGAYLVQETDYSNATLPSGDPANVAIGSAPFVVTVPTPLGDGQWNSDVHVYPKNSVTAVEKSVGDADNPGLGSTVTWTIETQIPTLQAGQAFTEFHLVDELDTRLEYAGPARLTINGSNVTFSETHTGADADGRGGTVTVSVTDLAALAAAQGETLTLELDTVVRGTGNIPNTATVFINKPTSGSGTDSNTVNTYWGAVEILKHAEGDADATLAGAVFTVHRTAADAENGVDAIVVDVDGTPTTQFTTATDGTVLIPGLYAGNEATDSVTYYLREVEAPAGYIASTMAIPVVVDANAVTQVVEIAVPNPQEPPINLPITGGSGTAVLILLGAGLMLAAIGLPLLAARRRRAAEQVV